jgi:hypothetical protein
LAISPEARYYGVDVIRDSIEWCQKNITARYPNIEVIHVDAESPMYIVGYRSGSRDNVNGSGQDTMVLRPRWRLSRDDRPRVSKSRFLIVRGRATMADARTRVTGGVEAPRRF